MTTRRDLSGSFVALRDAHGRLSTRPAAVVNVGSILGERVEP